MRRPQRLRCLPRAPGEKWNAGLGWRCSCVPVRGGGGGRGMGMGCSEVPQRSGGQGLWPPSRSSGVGWPIEPPPSPPGWPRMVTAGRQAHNGSGAWCVTCGAVPRRAWRPIVGHPAHIVTLKSTTTTTTQPRRPRRPEACAAPATTPSHTHPAPCPTCRTTPENSHADVAGRRPDRPHYPPARPACPTPHLLRADAGGDLSVPERREAPAGAPTPSPSPGPSPANVLGTGCVGPSALPDLWAAAAPACRVGSGPLAAPPL